MAQEIAVSERFRPCWRLVRYGTRDAARSTLASVNIDPDDYAVDRCDQCAGFHITGRRAQ